MSAVDDSEDSAKRGALAIVGLTIAEKFLLERLLGMGGMGAVYAATNTWTGRRVAVKMLLKTLSNPDAVARLQQEARAATSVRHPHILDVLDMCRDEEGNFLIVTELLAGESLEAMITKRGCMDTYRAVQLLVPIAAALAAAHKKGVVHRDLKPDNIFLHSEGGQIIPKVIDFGISKILDNTDARTRTQTGAIFGTVDYMSPEQAKGEAVDAQTDVWSLGVVLYRMLTAKFPFDAPTVSAILIKIATERAAPVRSLQPSVAPAIAAVVDRMLEPSRSARYPSFEDVLRDLLAWADTQQSPPLSQTYRAILGVNPQQNLSPVGNASSTPRAQTDDFSDSPTVVDDANGPMVQGSPTNMQWQRKSDEDLVDTTKIHKTPRVALALGAAVFALSAIGGVGYLATHRAPTVPLHAANQRPPVPAPAVAPSTIATVIHTQLPAAPSVTPDAGPAVATSARTSPRPARTPESSPPPSTRPHSGHTAIPVRREYE
ncbi:MAG: serine/threonine-protein kinase [Deltaproteobacteria bacterium]|nr:serine/threonine-protein kinase [Deltaproteobacteria bacterium]